MTSPAAQGLRLASQVKGGSRGIDGSACFTFERYKRGSGRGLPNVRAMVRCGFHVLSKTPPNGTVWKPIVFIGDLLKTLAAVNGGERR